MYKDMIDTIGYVKSKDEEVGAAMEQELRREQNCLELIASENIVSPAVMAAMGSVLTNKYAEGYPGKRYYGGCAFVDKIENIAIERAKQLFGAEHANVQPHSGTQANLAAYFAVLKPGDKVFGMNLAHGGHLSHGMYLNQSGKLYNFISYGVDDKTQKIDYEKLRESALKEQPKMIVAGASAYAREIDFKKIGEIAKECGAYFMVDMAHIAGLVAAGYHQNPVPYADIVTTTTHKTLRGPRGGLILCKKEFAKDIDRAVFPGSQGGPLCHVTAGKAVCFGEALKPAFKEYIKHVVENCSALAESLKGFGFNLVSGGTDNHLILVDLRSFNITGRDLEKKLDEVNITVNKNAIPNDPQKPFVTSGIRIGTAAVTTRGLNCEDMQIIGKCIYLAATDFENKANEIRADVSKLIKKYPLYE